MKRILMSFFFLIAISFSCQDKNTIDLEKEKQNVLNTDVEFSNFSEREGMKKAFLTFSDDEAVLLRSNSMPIEGKENIDKSFTKLNDSAFILTWKPLNGFISESADLAYTYGTYTLTDKNDTSETKGTYLSIWKKQENGTWKWVLDTGNEGLE